MPGTKYCMIVAGDSDFYVSACAATERLGYISQSAENGFHSYNTGDGDKVRIAIIDIETLRPAEIIEKLRSLEKERQLMLFCANPRDAERLKELFRDLPENPAIMPFNPLV